jgi:two-component system chemotaxis response regulator CheB
MTHLNMAITRQANALRVCIVDDDPAYRRILATTLAWIEGVEVAAAVATLAEAKRKIDAGPIDAVTIDVQLRGESGLELLPWLAAHHPAVVTVLVTAGLAREARMAVDALLLGASALVVKPSGPKAAAELSTALAAIFRTLPDKVDARLGDAVASLPPEVGTREVIAIGASTGGPPVLVQFLRNLDALFDVPILITQHMPALHVPYFAELLGRSSGRAVRIAVHGDVVEAAGVYVAGDDKHMQIARSSGRLIIVQDAGPLENQCRPAVDPLFRSVAGVCGAKAIGVVMSGMGSDGAKGALAMRRRGAPIVVQDSASSTVWGMPGATVAAGAASAIVPAGELAAAVQARTAIARRGGRRAVAG